MATGRQAIEGTSSQDTHWTLTIRGVPKPFASPDHEGWRSFTARLEKKYNLWLGFQDTELGEQNREALLEDAFRGLVDGEWLTANGEHPVEARTEEKREFLWLGLSLLDPSLKREWFDSLIDGLLATEFRSLKPDPQDQTSPERRVTSDDMFENDEEPSRKRISMDPQVMFGKPVITGTRIPVDLLLREFASGLSEAEILTEYPCLTSDDFRAAIAYAADCLPGPQVVASGRVS